MRRSFLALGLLITTLATSLAGCGTVSKQAAPAGQASPITVQPAPRHSHDTVCYLLTDAQIAAALGGPGQNNASASDNRQCAWQYTAFSLAIYVGNDIEKGVDIPAVALNSGRANAPGCTLTGNPYGGTATLAAAVCRRNGTEYAAVLQVVPGAVTLLSPDQIVATQQAALAMASQTG